MFWLWSRRDCHGAASRHRAHRPAEGRREETDLVWFLLGVIVLTTVGYFIFLKLAKFPTEVWYYLVWMAVMAVALDALLARAARLAWLRVTLCLDRCGCGRSHVSAPPGSACKCA